MLVNWLISWSTGWCAPSMPDPKVPTVQRLVVSSYRKRCSGCCPLNSMVPSRPVRKPSTLIETTYAYNMLWLLCISKYNSYVIGHVCRHLVLAKPSFFQFIIWPLQTFFQIYHRLWVCLFRHSSHFPALQSLAAGPQSCHVFKVKLDWSIYDWPRQKAIHYWQQINIAISYDFIWFQYISSMMDLMTSAPKVHQLPVERQCQYQMTSTIQRVLKTAHDGLISCTMQLAC